MLEVREEGEEVLFSLFLLAICPRKLMKGTVHINSQRGRHFTEGRLAHCENGIHQDGRTLKYTLLQLRPQVLGLEFPEC